MIRQTTLLTLALLACLAALPALAAEEPLFPEEPLLPAEPTVLDEPAPQKDARVAMLATTFFPGLGQLYNEEGLRTLVVFVWESYYIATILREGLEADYYKRRAATLAPGETWEGMSRASLRALFHYHEERQTDYIWYTAALLLASVLDAYVFAHLHSFETDDIRGHAAAVVPLLGRDSVGLGLRLSF
jgi:hypothetical protein